MHDLVHECVHSCLFSALFIKQTFECWWNYQLHKGSSIVKAALSKITTDVLLLELVKFDFVVYLNDLIVHVFLNENIQLHNKLSK